MPVTPPPPPLLSLNPILPVSKIAAPRQAPHNLLRTDSPLFVLPPPHGLTPSNCPAYTSSRSHEPY
ncbi:UNVERIFIED_CONTAM: hypothetical protein Sangu_2152700 [Sesamum angustifolium]|uniref:Uncharacterized protein n=1 Tax=Sesamum angustifolium TaxID=2727405 RepID=A0AAW2LE69_9LAMI